MEYLPAVKEWINLLARWFHVFAAILWVGSTYYFTWLDGRFQEEEKSATSDDDKTQVWMVHSGGFYVVEKRKTPSLQRLHWFRWEAAFTWLSGALLLVLVYHLGGGMVDTDVCDISTRTAVLAGVGLIVGGWVVYDLLVQSPLGRNETAFAVVAYALVAAAVYWITHVLSGRAAYIHVGATFGTIMAANVWMRILPAQRRMIAATKEGRTPDSADAARAKLRSKHNTFMVIPVVFTMISNHYPVSTYGNDSDCKILSTLFHKVGLKLPLDFQPNWVILCALILVGWVAAKLVRRA